jgi:hypothetical protein
VCQKIGMFIPKRFPDNLDVIRSVARVHASHNIISRIQLISNREGIIMYCNRKIIVFNRI